MSERTWAGYSVVDYTGGEARETFHEVEPVDLERAELELMSSGATRTGARSLPDNTDSLLVLFRWHALSDKRPEKWWAKVYETGRPWRRGVGLVTYDGEQVSIWGLWVPWRRPRLPKPDVELPGPGNVTPAQLLGLDEG